MRYFIALITCSMLIIALSCNNKKEVNKYDFPQIVENDTLRVITLNTSTSYFIYRDQKMGYHYDMIKNFANQYGLQVQVILAQNSSLLLQMLRQGMGDVVAFGIPIEQSIKDSITYCGLTQISHQVLVQRNKRKDTIINDVTKLIGKEIHVVKNSKYEQRMENLNEEVGGGINVKYVDEDTLVVEDLIRMVSNGEIKYTVADEYIARLNKTYFKNIDIGLQVSFDQRTSWAVRKDMPILADSLNAWFDRNSHKPNYLKVTKRYFEEAKGFFATDKYSLKKIKGQISPYDHIFKKYGEKYGLDWHLLTSMAYLESTFDPEGQSWAGARGLMGLMPATAKRFGVEGDDLFDPEKNVEAGAAYLAKLYNIFDSIDNNEERIKLTLAAYNGGIGHVMDARALTQKYGGDKDVWAGNVEKYIMLKRLEQYYKDPVCKVGYFRGDETVNYVRNVIDTWKSYK